MVKLLRNGGNSMNRRHFLTGAAAVAIPARRAAMPMEVTAALQRREESSGASPSTEPIMDRYRLTLNRVLHETGPAYTSEFLLEDIRATSGRRFTDFSGDVSGRWIGALSAAAAMYKQEFPVLDEVVHHTIALQHPEGYFGKTFHFDHPNDEDMALLWGNGRLLVGLMEYYTLKRDPAVLRSAEKLGDFLLRIGPNFNSMKLANEFNASHFAYSYICWTQQTEGLAALYAATKDTRYRDLCAAISERIERRAGDHVHGYLCSLRGTVNLYNATGDRAHLQRVEAAWQDVVHSGDILVTGGVPEAWSPKKKRTEGCAECDWLRLNLALWQATGNAMYLNTAERVLLNEFAMNQFSTGDFGHALLSELGTPAIVQVRAWWCCTLHGLRAFPDIHRNVFRVDGEEIFYDLPVDGHIETAEISVQATSHLASDGTVRIHAKTVSPRHTLTLRKPSWARDLNVFVNGRTVDGRTVTNMKAGDVVTTKYAMELREDVLATTESMAQRKLFFYGPWLLGAASEVNPGYFNELHPENKLIASSAHPANEKADSRFDVPIAATTVAYIPAEFPEQPSHMELRAVAEQTSIGPTQWEMAFLVKEKA